MDKDNVHIDNEFTDHSWQEMAKLLDQEMPVKKRKKRLIWIWFLGFGLLGLIGLTYLLQDNQPNLKSLPVPTITKKVVTNFNNKKVNHPSPTSDKSIKKVSNQSSTTKSSDNISVISTIKNPTKKSPTAASTPTAVGVGVSPTIPNNLASNKPSGTSNNLTTIESVLSPSFQKREIIDFIPITSLAPSLLPIKQQETIIPILPIKSRLKWRFGLYAGTLVPKFGSFRTGLYANLLLNNKWTLHFGLGYAKRISSTTVNNAQEVASSFPEIIETEDMSTTAGAGVNTDPAPSTNPNPNEIDLITHQPINFSNFHYFELPLLVNYRIQPKFSIAVGGSLSYLYGYRYQYHQTSIFTKDSNLGNAFSTTRTTDLLLTNAPTISTINWALIGGANYQLTNNLTAYANYHYSSPYLKTTTDAISTKKRWQQMELGIRYYFK